MMRRGEDDPEERREERRDEHLVDEPVPLDHVRGRRRRSRTPIIPPISAWLELEGRPRYHVIRFQVIAPTRPGEDDVERDRVRVDEAARDRRRDREGDERAGEVQDAAERTASRGESARVETLVAIEFAVSWKPFVKSKKSATATTRRARSVHGALGVLHDDVPDHVRGRLAGVERVLERLEDVLPADDDQRVDARVAEEVGDRVADDPVAFVLELASARRAASCTHATSSARASASARCSTAPTRIRALLDRLAGRRLDAVELEQVGRLLDVVDDVVDRRRELEDVLAVERRHVLGVQELDEVARDPVALVLGRLHVRLGDRGVRELAEARLRFLAASSALAPASVKSS